MADTTTQVVVNDIPDYMKPYRQAILNAGNALVFNTGTDWFHQTFPSGSYVGGNSTPPPTTGNGSGDGSGNNPTLTQPSPTVTKAIAPQQNSLTPIYQDQYAGQRKINPVQRGPVNAGGLQGLRGLSGANSVTDMRLDPKLGYVPDLQPQGYARGGIMRRDSGGSTSATKNQLDAAYAALANSGVQLGSGGSPVGGIYNPVVGGGWNVPSKIPVSTIPKLINSVPIGLFPNGLAPPAAGGGSGMGTGAPQQQQQGPPPLGSGIGAYGPGNGPAPTTAQAAPIGMFTAGGAGTGPAQSVSDSGYNPGQYATDADASRLAQLMGGKLSHTNVSGPIAPPSQNIVDMGGAAQLNAGLVQQQNNWAGQDPSKQYLALMQQRTTIANDGGDTSAIDAAIAQATKNYQANGNNPTPGPVDQAEAANRIGGHKRGGVIRKADGGPDVLGSGTSNQALNNSAAPAASNSIFNAYVPYTAQRVLGYSPSFGQVGPDGTIQASNLTQQGLAATGNLPSIYDQNGNINPNSPTGNAWNYEQNSADASQHASAMANQFMDNVYDAPGVQSSFGSVMQGIANDPSKFQAGDITTPNITAPQLDQPQSVQSQTAQQTMSNIGPLNAATNNWNSNGLQNYQMAGPSNVNAGQTSTGQWGSQAANQYMSPYLSSVLQQQQGLDQQRYNEQQGQRNSAATAAGAFGGSRQAVADSIAQRDFNQAEALQQSQALNSGYQNAQQQYASDQARNLASQQTNVGANLQGQMANQNAGLTAGQANLGANLQTQNLGATTGLQAALANQQAQQQANLAQYGMQGTVAQQASQQDLNSQLANQQAGLTAGQANLGSSLATQQLGMQSGLSAAQANQQTRLAQNQALLQGSISADQLHQQAYQANMADTLAALSQGNQSATAYNNMGVNFGNVANQAQQMALQQSQAQQQAGSTVDAQSQNALNLGYQDFINQKNDPYQKLNFLQGLESGTPFGTQMEGTQFQKAPAGGLAGLGVAGAGAILNSQQQPQSSGFKKGGLYSKRKVRGGLMQVA